MANSTTRKWIHEDVCRLIDAYESHPILWDIKNSDFKNRIKKNEVMEKLATDFNCTALEVSRKLHNLRNQVSQELKKIKNKRSGSGIEEIKTWPYFSSLSFIVPSLEAAATQCNLMPTSSNFVYEQKELANAGDSNEATQIDEINKKSLANKTKRKKETKGNDSVIKAALKVLSRNPDEDDKFGEYVAFELRSLKFEYVRRRLKTEIRKAILRAVQEEDTYFSSPARSSSTILSPPPPPLTPSPTHPILPENSSCQSENL